jgi:predicted ArsR family transcriptional regulator
MRVRGDVTVDELAGELQLTRTTIVNHLNSLMGEGYVRRSGLRRGRRRPSVIYKLTPSADRIFPQMYEEFLTDVLEDLSSRRPTNIKQVIRGVRDRWIARDLPAVEGLRGKQRINRTLDVLSKRGFMPVLQSRGRVPVLQQHNCPLVRLCERYPDVPDLVLRWIKALFGTPATRLGCIAIGNASCSYVLGRGARSLNK